MIEPILYYLDDNDIVPNSYLPVLHYPGALELPFFFRSRAVKQIFSKHGWTNNVATGIYTISHYHSMTHKVLGVITGRTTLLLGGVNGVKVPIRKGDVIIIPAGVALGNLRDEHDVVCIAGFPDGRNHDMNYCKKTERPRAEKNIADLPLPAADPLYGAYGPLMNLWRQCERKAMQEVVDAAISELGMSNTIISIDL